MALLYGIVYEFGAIPGDATRQFLSMVLALLVGTALGLLRSR